MFRAKSIARVRAFAIVTAGLLGLLLSASIALAKDVSGPLTGSVPKAICGPGDHTESGLQGQTTPQERSSGDSKRAYNCNLELVGQYQGEGNYSQDGPAYADHCAYYGTDHDSPLQQHPGLTVIDASDPRHPVASTFLDDTAAALVPHETPRHNDRRNLLAVGQLQGPNFAVYDTSADCAHPVLKGSIDLPGSIGHMGNFTADGLTFYLTQNALAIGGFVYLVDLTDPSNLKELPRWQYLGNGMPHDVFLNADGTRMYAGQIGLFGNPPPPAGLGQPDGLVIEDVSDYQFRRPNPQIRIISTLFWDDQGGAEDMHPFSKNGRQYLISSDETGGAGGVGGLPAACARVASPFGYPNIIDITDETNPKIVAKLRLQVNDPANCALLVNDPPEVGGGIPAYNEERCTLVLTIRQCSRAPSNMLACEFSTFAIFPIPRRLRTTSQGVWEPLSFPDHCYGIRSLIERLIG